MKYEIIMQPLTAIKQNKKTVSIFMAIVLKIRSNALEKKTIGHFQ